MLTSVEGYYNGHQIVMDESVALREGQRVIITILEPTAERTKKAVHLARIWAAFSAISALMGNSGMPKSSMNSKNTSIFC